MKGFPGPTVEIEVGLRKASLEDVESQGETTLSTRSLAETLLVDRGQDLLFVGAAGTLLAASLPLAQRSYSNCLAAFTITMRQVGVILEGTLCLALKQATRSSSKTNLETYLGIVGSELAVGGTPVLLLRVDQRRVGGASPNLALEALFLLAGALARAIGLELVEAKGALGAVAASGELTLTLASVGSRQC